MRAPVEDEVGRLKKRDRPAAQFLPAGLGGGVGAKTTL
jgi:hypothetical protein